MKEYWFYIDSFVHMEIRPEKILFYNSVTKGFYVVNKSKSIFKLIDEICKEENLRIIKVNKEQIADKTISGFISKIREYFMGDLIPIDDSQIKPIQIPAIVDVNNDVRKTKRYEYKILGENQMKHLNELNIYITGKCNLSCHFCHLMHKQILICDKNSPNEIETGKIISLIEQAKYSPCKINLLGGNLFLYPNFKKLIKSLCQFKQKVILNFHYINFISNTEVDLIELSNEFRHKFTIDDFDSSLVSTLINMIEHYNIKSEIVFIIKSEYDYNRVQEYININNIENYTFSPFYHTENEAFFKSNIYSTIDDIQESAPSLKSIYTNSVLNSYNFGVITIQSNGDALAGLTGNVLGNISEHTLYDLIFKELSEGVDWFRLRKDIEPCNECVYSNICPPLGPYESAINKNNLCIL
jgi:pseudo-rSAM protein